MAWSACSSRKGLDADAQAGLIAHPCAVDPLRECSGPAASARIGNGAIGAILLCSVGRGAKTRKGCPEIDDGFQECGVRVVELLGAGTAGAQLGSSGKDYGV